MADTKISLLDAAAALDGTEELPIVQSAATVKTTAQDIADLAPAPAFADVTGKPTTLAGYGITDAASDAELASHEADTTSVHGIADTSTLYRSGGTDVAVADGGTGASTAANARANLGLVIGTDVAPATSSLAAAASIDGSEVVPIVQTGADKTIDLQSIADLASPGGVGVREVDGSPSVTNVLTIVVPNGTLTDNGSGVVTYTPAAAGSAGYGSTASRQASSPSTGALWFDTTLFRSMFYDGSVWRFTDTWGDADTVVVADTFTAANGTAITSHTTDTGGLTWAAFNATGGTINSNAVTFASSAVCGLTLPTPDYVITVDITAASGLGLYVRHPGTSSVTGISVKNDSGTWKWYKDNTLVISTGIAYSAGQTIRVVVVGEHHTLIIGSSRHTYVDATYTHQKRIACYDAITLDNLSITAG